MNLLFVCLKIIIFICKFSGVLSKLQTMYFVDKYEVCYATPDVPFAMLKLDILFDEKSGNYGKGVVEVKRSIPNKDFRITAAMTKCKSKEARDTCEFFTELKPPNACALLNAKYTAWERMVNSFEPPFKCPFRKGLYITNNYSVNADAFKLFPLFNYYWEVNMTFYAKNESISICIGAKITKKNV